MVTLRHGLKQFCMQQVSSHDFFPFSALAGHFGNAQTHKTYWILRILCVPLTHTHTELRLVLKCVSGPALLFQRTRCSCNLPGEINSLSAYSGVSPCSDVIVGGQTRCMFVMQYYFVMSCRHRLVWPWTSRRLLERDWISSPVLAKEPGTKCVCGRCSLSVTRCRMTDAKSCWWEADEEMDWKRGGAGGTASFIDHCRRG